MLGNIRSETLASGGAPFNALHVCRERNQSRPDRQFGRHVIAHQRSQLRRGLRGLGREGFRDIFHLRTVEEVDAVSIERVPLWTDLRVARKLRNLGTRLFRDKGIHVEVIKLYGSIEIAPLVGLCERIVDLVSTGGTLKANGLVEVETIMNVTARLVVNRGSLKTKTDDINRLVRTIEKSLLENPIRD